MTLLEEAKQLSLPERILLVEDLWDSVAQSSSSEVPQVANGQRQELDRRLAAHQARLKSISTGTFPVFRAQIKANQ